MDPITSVPRPVLEGVEVEWVDKQVDLGKMLAAGQIDALIFAHIPEAVLEGSPHVGTLFEDPRPWSATMLPVLTLFVAKLIIDEVAARIGGPRPTGGAAGWLASGRLDRLGLLPGAEFGLAVLADVLGWVVSLIESLLAERVSNVLSIRVPCKVR